MMTAFEKPRLQCEALRLGCDAFMLKHELCAVALHTVTMLASLSAMARRELDGAGDHAERPAPPAPRPGAGLRGAPHPTVLLPKQRLN
jgi:hypothetical protein